jgi:hypothetical protein
MNLSQTKRHFATFARTGDTVGLIGPPGIGKTWTIEDWVRELKASDIRPDLAEPGDDKKPVKLIVRSLTTMEPVDVVGPPVVENGRSRNAVPSWIPTGNEAAVVFLDEALQADFETQKAAARLIDRQVDGCDVSPRCLFIIASNGDEDGCGVVEPPRHLLNRVSWFTVASDKASWLQWAAGNDVFEPVVDFIRNTPESNLNAFNADSTAKAYATERSVTKLAKQIEGAPMHDWRDLAEATCGSTWAATFIEWLRVNHHMPSIEDVLTNPGIVTLPTNFGILRAVIRAVIDYGVSEPGKYREPVLELLVRIKETTNHKELAAMGLRDLCTRDGEYSDGRVPVMDAPETRKFIAKFSELVA